MVVTIIDFNQLNWYNIYQSVFSDLAPPQFGGILTFKGESFLGNSVWDRRNDRAANAMTRRLYLLMVCFWTAAGIVFSGMTSTISQDWPIQSWGTWGLLGFMLGILAVALAGVFIAHSSENPIVSLIGYALVSGPFGLLLGPVLALYETSSILKVLAITATVVIVLGLVGVFIPDDLSPWGLWLTGGLLLVIAAQFIVPLLGGFGLPVEGAMTLVDWIALVIFGGLVIFDLNRAIRLPFTHDNAIDSAVAIYLDFINIFIRLLSLMGQKK